MEYDIEATKERIEKLKLSEAKRKRREEATAKGFTRVEDYDVWLVLEELRERTLQKARDEAPRPTAGNLTVNTGAYYVGGHISSLH